MYGRIKLMHQGHTVIIERMGSKAGQMQGFRAYLRTACSMCPVKKTNCGRELTGVGREAFEKSAFIGQSGIAKTEARLSLNAGYRRLPQAEGKLFRTARRRTAQPFQERHIANRSNGALPREETRLQEIEQNIMRIREAAV
jgi:hypothetical protein